MPRIGIELPIHVDNPNLPTFPLAWIRPVGEPPLEPSDAHWMFYGPSPLTDKLGGHVLTPSSEGDYAISGGVLLQDVAGNTKWAKSDLVESEPRTFSHMVSVDVDGLLGSGLNVALIASLSGGGSGFALHLTPADKLRFTWKQNQPYGIGSFGHYCEVDVPPSAGKFLWICATETPTDTTLYVGNAGALDSNNVTHSTRALGSGERPAAIGTPYYSTGSWAFTGTVRVIEWAEDHTAWDAERVQAAYDRSRLLRAPYVGRVIA